MLKNYFSLKEYEVRASLIFSILFTGYAYYLNLYNNWDLFEEGIKNITIYIAAGMIGMLGLIFAAISLLFSIIDNQLARRIENNNSRENSNVNLNDIFKSFDFIIKHTAFQILIFFALYITIFSKNSLIPNLFFFILLFIVIYLFLFTIFYIVALINCFTNIFMAKLMYEEIENIENYLTTLELEYYSSLNSPDQNLQGLRTFISNKNINLKLKNSLLNLLNNR